MINRGRTQKAIELIQNDQVDINLQNSSGDTPLHLATSKNNTKIIDALLHRGNIAINVQNKLGNTLHVAALNSYKDNVTKLLLEAGANKKIKNNEGAAPFEIADKSGLTDVADLLRFGIDENGNSALHIAIWNKNTERAIQIIQEKETNIDLQNKFGDTPLHMAVSKNNRKLVEEILRAGANKTIHNNAGSSPLELAEKINLKQIAEMLR